jgi:signal transduction histidine kinase
VIGAPILILGLLLLLTGLFSARIPGEASFASSGIPFAPRREGEPARDPLRAFLFSPIHPATWNAVLFVVLGFVVGVVAFASIISVFSAGAASLLAGIGIVLIVLGIEGSRLVARLERRRARLADPRPVLEHPYRPLRGDLATLIRAEFLDEARWRDVLYVGVNFPLVVLEFVLVVVLWGLTIGLLAAPVTLTGAPALWTPLAVVAGIVLLPIAASLTQLVAVLHRAVISGLIGTSETRELRRQVETLRESRSAVLDAEAGELRRIERDLHDGAQQRLVMLTIDLGLAAERIDTDAAAAKELVLEARSEAQQALAEIRSLVRGIAPAILLDRGLVPAIESISARGAVPTSVRSELPAGERLPDAIERAAYFVVAEALVNVAKHSGATRCEVRCRREGANLVVEVWDDGRGGATVGPVGGLAGLTGRVEGVDGRFDVSSPAGGPTLIAAAIPVPAWQASAAPATPGPAPVTPPGT